MDSRRLACFYKVRSSPSQDGDGSVHLHRLCVSHWSDIGGIHLSEPAEMLTPRSPASIGRFGGLFGYRSLVQPHQRTFPVVLNAYVRSGVLRPVQRFRRSPDGHELSVVVNILIFKWRACFHRDGSSLQRACRAIHPVEIVHDAGLPTLPAFFRIRWCRYSRCVHSRWCWNSDSVGNVLESGALNHRRLGR